MDLTQDLLQLSSNNKETSERSFLELLEEIEHLQDVFETQKNITETETEKAVPEPQLCMPLTVHDEDSQQETTQNWVKALTVPPEDTSEVSPTNQKVVSFDQIHPTATSWMTDVTDIPETFSAYQNLTESHAVASSNDQTFSGSQIIASGDQILCGGQMVNPCDEQALYGCHMTFNGNQTSFGDPMNFSGGQIKPLNVDQAHNGGQITALTESTMTFIGNQTFTEDQMLTYSHDQTFYGGQMMTFTGDQALCGDPLLGGHMTTFTNDHNLCGDHMRPYQLSSYPGFLYSSSAHLIQRQSQEKQKQNLKSKRCWFQKNSGALKPYSCTYQDCGKSYLKSSHLRVHERSHTGEKPYVCNVEGCSWKFSRSDELSRHKRKHTGERPYVCMTCKKDFTRSDHLKQHARIHR